MLAAARLPRERANRIAQPESRLDQLPPGWVPRSLPSGNGRAEWGVVRPPAARHEETVPHPTARATWQPLARRRHRSIQSAHGVEEHPRLHRRQFVGVDYLSHGVVPGRFERGKARSLISKARCLKVIDTSSMLSPQRRRASAVSSPLMFMPRCDSHARARSPASTPAPLADSHPVHPGKDTRHIASCCFACSAGPPYREVPASCQSARR